MFDTKGLTKRIEEAAKLLGEPPKRIILSQDEYVQLSTDKQWKQKLFSIPEDAGIHPVGHWKNVDVLFEIKARCYHLNARLNVVNESVLAQCPECNKKVSSTEIFNGWGDWLRENVFNKTTLDAPHKKLENIEATSRFTEAGH